MLDGSREISTGASETDIRKAEEGLARYIDQKRLPNFGDGHPNHVLIADVLAEYGENHAPQTRRPDLIGGAIAKLLGFFKDRTAGTITPQTSSQYLRWRTLQADARAHLPIRRVKSGTARRELVVLSAALRWCWKERKLDRPVIVSLPSQPGPRERHLSRGEVATLLAAALGWDQNGVRHRHRINRHLARFILIALYTGTRHRAILGLQWTPNLVGGWVDLAAGVIYRKPYGDIDSVKRRPPVPIPPRLMPHLERWRRLSTRYVIEYAGLPIRSQERRAWQAAREMAGLEPDVTPHVLRHTCATMLLQLGVSVYDVAGVLGTSEDVIRRTYGHHAPSQLRRALSAFSRRARP